MADKFIAIGESVHASIPKTGKVMKELHALGPDAYTKQTEQLDYIKNLIETQVDDGADYIAVNIDIFGEDDPQIAIDIMAEYVKLVRKWSKGVPVCIDSSDPNVLIRGLKEWYNTDEKVAQPLINSINVDTMDILLPLKKDYDFAVVGILISEEKGTGPGGSHSADELYELAKRIFKKAVNEFGFKPEEIIFDSTVFPLAIDMPMTPGEPSYTYRTFETIKKVKNDPEMQGVHFSGGITNSVRDLPGRKIGVARAYVQKAQEYGLDAGIVNPSHNFGTGGADPELLELVDAYAKMDGSAEAMNNAMMIMGKFCADNRK